MYINADECVDRGACEPVCPVEAIYYVDDLPAAIAPFAAARPSSSPGSAAPAVLRASAGRATTAVLRVGKPDGRASAGGDPSFLARGALDPRVTACHISKAVRI
ncbi:hypothetical protein PSU4_07070 [Pseudonocardia sulfidoxydans NBRC 16205]|uniref:4Fe-4S ferredoxin-type domain-containing protein n=1 Tax=Pseudonocardia sulfidoxydans NBRC 16205 TaxID=1223511 RepID=A0A511DBI2_9PSEU|nr:hypothetical protein PSU4_07070 [Pseudonocardia sulfidoxydans NBRC 16205]